MWTLNQALVLISNVYIQLNFHSTTPRLLLDVEKHVFTWSVMYRKVIFEKSIIEEDTLYKMMLVWDQFGQAIITNMLFILDCCFINSVLALIAVAVVQKSTAKNFFPYPCTASKTSFYIGLLCIVFFLSVTKREGFLWPNVTERGNEEWVVQKWQL